MKGFLKMFGRSVDKEAADAPLAHVPLDQELLDRYPDLAPLSAAHKSSIIRTQELEFYHEGDAIEGLTDPSVRVYLVMGSVLLQSADGAERRLDVDEPQGGPALDRGYGTLKGAIALGETSVFLVPEKLFTGSAGDNCQTYAATGIQVEEIDDAANETLTCELVYQLYTDSVTSRLKLPSLPELAIKVRRVVADEDSGVEDMAKVIQADIGITGRLIQIANGAFYRGLEPTTTLQGAIIRMGMATARDIAIGLSMKNMFDSDDPKLYARMKQLWSHSTYVAAISGLLAEQCGMDPERGLLAGLMHDVGTLAILEHISKFEEDSYTDEDVDEAIRRLRGDVGVAIMQEWHFDDEMITVVEEAENYLRNSEDGPDLCDIVQVAQIHALFGKPGAALLPPLVQIPAYNKMPISEVGPDGSLELITQAKADIAETIAMLGG